MERMTYGISGGFYIVNPQRTYINMLRSFCPHVAFINGRRCGKALTMWAAYGMQSRSDGHALGVF